MSTKKTEIKFDERVLEFKNDLYEKSIHNLKNVIPAKIQEFNKLAEKHSACIKNDDVDVPTQTLKKRKLQDDEFEVTPLEEIIKTNKYILETTLQLKKHYVEIIEIFSTIRCWISLNIPRIEDGNNFGVDVQEEVISQITKLEEVYTALLEGIESHFLQRAAIVKKALKHKDIDAYKYAIAQLDEKEYVRFNFAYFDLANNYATTYSLVVKNFAKLEQPRPTNAASSMF